MDNDVAHRRKLSCVAHEGETASAARARAAGDPAIRSVSASRTLIEQLLGPQDLNDALRVLEMQIDAASSGDASGLERMLVAQANTLDVIFNQLTGRAAACFGENLGSGEAYMRLALKAQSQARATLETTAALKNPSVVITKHANVNSGTQQVYYGDEATLADETQSKTHRLLSHTGTSGHEIPADPEMAALETVDRTDDGGR